MQPAKTPFIRIGDFFFKYRNLLFPAMLAVVFFTYAPAHRYFGSHVLEQFKDVLAVLLVFVGLALRGAVIGFAYIKRGGLNKEVYADTLVTEGFFATSRNPLYVGNMLIYMGVFVMHGAPAVMIGGTLAMYGIYSSIIAAEEYFLRGKFGAAFDAYCAEVPRWLPRLSRLKAATSGMEFNTKRVLVKDYSTIVNSLVALTAIEGIEIWEAHGGTLGAVPLTPLALVALLLALAAGMSFAKKRRWISAA